MAETHTVGPSKSYSTLQAADDDQDGSLAGRGVVTFECYDGSNLGSYNVSGWSGADATNYVRVFVPLAERHLGIDDGTGAYISHNTGGAVAIATPYTRIEGLRVLQGSLHNAMYINAANNAIIDSCLIVADSSVGMTNGISSRWVNVDATVTVRNNIILGAGLGVGGGTNNYGGIHLNQLASSGTKILTATVENNTVSNIAVTSMGLGYGILLDEMSIVSGTAMINCVAVNNISVGNAGGDYWDNIANGSTGGSGYNLSSDATGDDWGATGAVINETDTDVLVDVDTDANLKSGSAAIDAGYIRGTFDHDALHVDSDNWRPQGSSWDMGAIEKEAASTSPIEGTFTKTDTLSAAISATGDIAGTFTKTNTFSATIDGLGTAVGIHQGNHTLSATLSAVGSMDGLLQSENILGADISGLISAVGSFAKTSTFAGTLDGLGTAVGIHQGNHTLTATLTATAAADGIYSKTNTLAATIDGLAALSGAFTKTSTFSGSLLAKGLIEGTYTKTSTLSGTLDGLGTAVGIHQGNHTLSATLTGKAAAAGSYTKTNTLGADITGWVYAVGEVTNTNTLSGTLTGTSRIVGSFTKSNTFAGTIDGLGTAIGIHQGNHTLSATLTATGSMAGTHTATHTLGLKQERMFGTFTKTNTLSATLTGLTAVVYTSGIVDMHTLYSSIVDTQSKESEVVTTHTFYL